MLSELTGVFIALTTDPKFLIQFIEAAAKAQGVDLGILREFPFFFQKLY